MKMNALGQQGSHFENFRCQSWSSIKWTNKFLFFLYFIGLSASRNAQERVLYYVFLVVAHVYVFLIECSYFLILYVC